MKAIIVGELKGLLVNVPDEVEVWISDDTSEKQELKPVTETFFDSTEKVWEDGTDNRYFLLAYNPKGY